MTSKHRRIAIAGRAVPALVGILAVTVWLPALSARAQVIDRDLAACARITEPARRLACYDAVMRARAKAGERSPAAADQEGMPTSPTTLSPSASSASRPLPGTRVAGSGDDFGLPPPPPPREEAREYILKAMRRSPTGAAILTMDDGAVWRQIDDKSLPRLRPGSKVRVKRGLMGSYILVVDRWSVRARRIR